MKKKLESDLISIAHRILQIKDRSDINQLYFETQKLYEKLAILRFVEEHFEGPKPTIGQAEIVEKMKLFFEENHISSFNLKKEEQINVEQNQEEQKLENKAEIKTEIKIENEEIIQLEKTEDIQISFSDLMGADYFKETTFVKVDVVDVIEETTPAVDYTIPEKPQFLEKEFVNNTEAIIANLALSKISLNEKLSKTFQVDLNNRIAFVKHLFGNSEEDYNRVMSQLITFNDFEETENFIENIVKPDYNNWEGKDDYVQRFIEIIEKKFA